jgi:DNA-binding IclR family transcriptional regulator
MVRYHLVPIPDSTADRNMAIKKKSSDGEGVAAVNRALTIVIALETAGEAMSLADLSRKTGLYKSTLLRLIASLEQFALVVARPDKKYCLGPLAFRLGRSFEATDHLRDQMVPALERLVEQGTESASFHVRHDPKQRLCLFRVDSQHSTLDRLKAGDLIPIDRGGAGKAIRMFEQQLSKEDLLKHESVVESFGERNPIIAGISAPVFGVGNLFYGVISLSGPIERFTDSNIRKMKRLLIGECREVTTALGGQWPWP